MDSLKKDKIPRILIVDDVEINLSILEEIIQGMGYVPRCASSAKEAARLVDEERPQLILLDIYMPEVGGFEFSERLKKNVHTRDIPIIFISGDTAKENKWKGFELGCVDFITKPFDMREVAMRVNTHLKIYQMKQELEDSNRNLHMVIENQMKRLEEEQRNTLYALARISEENDQGRESHMENVGHNCRILAQSLQLSPDFRENVSENFIQEIEVASMLHDIGKLRVPEGVIVNPLTEDDEKNLEELDVHARQGAHMLKQIYDLTFQNEFLAMAIEIARYHHTRWDGKGKPRGIQGKEIPLSARITAVVDMYDIIQEDYKDHITEEEGLALLESRAGVYYDPEIVRVFMKVRRQMRKVER